MSHLFVLDMFMLYAYVCVKPYLFIDRFLQYADRLFQITKFVSRRIYTVKNIFMIFNQNIFFSFVKST